MVGNIKKEAIFVSARSLDPLRSAEEIAQKMGYMPGSIITRRGPGLMQEWGEVQQAEVFLVEGVKIPKRKGHKPYQPVTRKYRRKAWKNNYI